MPASSIAIIERIAVGVVKTFVDLVAREEVELLVRVEAALALVDELDGAERHGPSSGAMPAAHAHSPMPWKRSPSWTSWQ